MLELFNGKVDVFLKEWGKLYGLNVIKGLILCLKILISFYIKLFRGFYIKLFVWRYVCFNEIMEFFCRYFIYINWDDVYKYIF